MQQRRLRLGDILDDYCPRERRITNHAVVAMIDDQVKQTRCTTCDADHEYKEARVPASRRRKTAVQSEPHDDGSHPVLTSVEPSSVEVIVDEEPLLVSDQVDAAEPLDDAATVADAMAGDVEESSGLGDDEGPVHRRLIRATLPRPEGQAPEWREPDFTVRQPGRPGRENDGNRGGGHGQRPGRRRSGRGGGQGAAGGQSRFGAPRQGNPRHSGQGGHGHANGNRGNSRGPSRGGEHRGGPGRKRGR